MNKNTPTPSAQSLTERMLSAGSGEKAIARRGMLFVLSSPSGAGKSTLARRLREADPEIAVSVSCTTRPPRPGEIDGTDYHFKSVSAFQQMADGGLLLEHATVFGNLYGTPRAPVENWLADGRDVLFDIDWQGARQLRQTMPEDIVSVFILPPSLAELEARLRARSQDSDEVIAGRMAKAVSEISHWDEYSYVLINDDLEAAERKVAGILLSERLKRTRQIGLQAYICEMMQEVR